MKTPAFEQVVGGVMALGALGIIGFSVVTTGNEQATGALIALMAAAVGFYYRGKVEKAA